MIEEHEIMFNGVTLRKGKFTDQGYRFQYNEYIRVNSDLFSPLTPNDKKVFYQTKMYNNDVFEFNDDE